MQRLSPDTLNQVRPGTRLPAYAWRTLMPGILHLGLGAFVRAHLASYMDDLLAIEPGPWGIAGVSLKPPDQRPHLNPQGCLYSALAREGESVQATVRGAIRAVWTAPDDLAPVLAFATGPACRILSLTVTEKGYCHDPATGRLQAAHPDIRHDLEHPAEPASAVGLVVEALARRRAAGLGPFTVLSCDNLPHNGRLLAGLVHDFALLRDGALEAWITANCTFPSTMVDRIVPATTPADMTAAAEAIGLDDAAPVVHEPFRQWVIEDRFVDDARPAWEKVGAELVGDVAPYEHMKHQLLNGTHSALAYLGYLAGHETIAETVADEVFRRYVTALWRDEIIPVVPPPPNTDLHRYADELLTRYRNPAIRHRTWQIAMDGSQKLPQRLLMPIRARQAKGWPLRGLALAVAGWIRYVGGVDEAGRPIDVRDPLASELRQKLEQAGSDPAARVGAILATEAVFGTDLPNATAFVAAVNEAYALLLTKGARAAVAATAA